jgi:hypothetical protein
MEISMTSFAHVGENMFDPVVVATILDVVAAAVNHCYRYYSFAGVPSFENHQSFLVS